MDEGEMRSIKNVIEIVIIVVHLHGRKLAFVNNIGRGKGTDVEAGPESTEDQLMPGENYSHFMRCLLA